LPTKRDLEKKGAQMTKFINQPMTEVRASLSPKDVFVLSHES
jgi:hypothetical protein